MKRFLSLLAGAALALAAVSAQAAVSAPLTINYTVPTTGCTTINGVPVSPCDGVPLTGADVVTSIAVYVSTSPIPNNFTGDPTLVVGASPQSVNTSVSITNGQTVYVRLKALSGTGVSDFSAEASKTFTLGVKPGVPTSVTITINVS